MWLYLVCIRFETQLEQVMLDETGVVQWFRLALPKGPNWVGVFPHSIEDGNRASFRNVVFFYFLVYRMMEKVEKPSNTRVKLDIGRHTHGKCRLEIKFADWTLQVTKIQYRLFRMLECPWLQFPLPPFISLTFICVIKTSKNVHLQILAYVNQKKKFWIEVMKFLFLLHRPQVLQILHS
jgi:hypothetical protein